MPTVPYSPVPLASSNSATPSIRVDTPGAAFGVGAADALSHLGKVGAGIGDEIYARAKALQDLKNDAEAKDADAEYMIRVGEMHAAYNALQGKSAVDAYPVYQKDLESARLDIAGKMSNQMSRKMFDSASRQTMSRTIFNGAGHAATQQKRYALGASAARVEAITSQAASTPNDDIAFNRNLETMASEIGEQATLGGWGEDEKNHKLNSAISTAWMSRISSLSRTQPFKAKEMLEANRDKILGQDQEKIDKVVTGQLRTVGGRNISDAVNSGWAPYMKQPDIDRTQGVESSLIQVVKRAQQISSVPFTIGGQGGVRTPEEQADLVRRGRSQTYNSDHLGGRAIDLVPLKDGKSDYKDREGLTKIGEAMQKASEELGIPLKPRSKSFTSWDPYHYQLTPEFNVATAPKPKEEGLQSRVDRAKDYAKTIAPEDSVFADYVGERVMTDFTRTRAFKRDAEMQSRNVLDGAIVGNFGKGNLPTTVEELKAQSPEVATAWDSLDETKQRTYLSYLARNAKGDVQWNPERLRRFQTLLGMARENPAKFQDTDMLSEDLPRNRQLELVKLQERSFKKSEDNPQIRQALQILGPDLAAAKITRKDDEDGYYRFVGALGEAMADYLSENKKPMKREDVLKLGAQLLQEQADPSKWNIGVPFTSVWTQRTSPVFRQSLPDSVVEQVQEDILKRGGAPKTAAQINAEYTRQLLNKFYPSKTKANE